MKYIEYPLIVLDVAVNVILLGSRNETLSARAWRMYSEGKPWGLLWRPIIDGIFFWQPDHCRVQWERESAAGSVWASLQSTSA
jgi:hypothetical protein